MSARTVSTRRTATTVAAALLAAGALLSTSACGAGQISQTANQVAAINGANKTFVDQQAVLSDVHVLYPLAAKGKGELAFVLTNLSTTKGDRLKSITDESGATATITGDTTIAPSASLYGTAPQGSDKNSELKRLTVTVPVDDSWRPGLTRKLTFHTERAGDLQIDVPLSAGATPASVAAITETAGAGEGHGEGH